MSLTGFVSRLLPTSLKLAAGFLMPIGRWCDRPDADGMARAARWFPVVGLFLGLVWLWVFWAAWGRFGVLTGLRLMQAASLVLITGLVFQIKWWIGLGVTVDHLVTPEAARGDPSDWPTWGSAGTLGVGLMVLFWFSLVLCLRTVPWAPPPGKLGEFGWIRRLFPREVLRVLVLAPMWGTWAVTAAASIGGRAGPADAAMEGIARAMSPPRLLWHLMLPLSLTTLYFWTPPERVMGLLIALLTMAGTFMMSIVVGWKSSGHTRWSVLGVGAFVQMLYLALYATFKWQMMFRPSP